MKALGLSAKVKDGWSFRSLQQMLRVGPSKLHRFVADGLLRVRDPRISAASLGARFEQLAPSRVAAAETITKTFWDGPEAYSWKRAGKLLGVTVEQVRVWIAKGNLNIVDTFVTDRAFEAFCKRFGTELNPAFLGKGIREWLVDEYGLQLPSPEKGVPVPAAQKHALIIRHCPTCQTAMRGNIFFRHVKNCKGLKSVKAVRRKQPLRSGVDAPCLPNLPGQRNNQRPDASSQTLDRVSVVQAPRASGRTPAIRDTGCAPPIEAATGYGALRRRPVHLHAAEGLTQAFQPGGVSSSATGASPRLRLPSLSAVIDADRTPTV